MALLDAPVSDATWRALGPSERRRQTLDAVRRLLLEESRRQPLLLIVEDLHWIDGQTQAVLDTLVENLGSARVLLLVSYRPQYRHVWAGKTFYTQLPLDILPAELASELLDALLGEDPGLGPLKSRLVDRANPLLLEETVRTLVETGMLAGDRGDYRLTQPIRTLQLPPTVQALLTERVDRLPAEDRRVLQTAAVIGTSVPLAWLEAVADTGAGAVRAALGRLQTAEFLHETGHDPDVEYAFKHVLTHEAAYATLAPERRRELHARIVDIIETRCGDRLAEYVERLAHHALSAELAEKAARYLGQAGVKATARSALPEARDRFEQALDVLATLPESRPIVELRIDLCLELRPLLVHLGEVGRALERLREAERLADDLDDDRRRGRVCAVMANAFSLLGEPDEALVVGRRAMGIARRSNDLRLRVLTTIYLEQAYLTRGDYEEVVALALENIRSLPAEWVNEFFGAAIPISLYDRYRLLNALAQLGRFHEAARYEAEVLRLAEPSRYAITVAMVHDAASWCRMSRGDWETARALNERALVAHREASSHLTLAHAVAVSAHVLARLGEAAAAAERLREGMALVAAQTRERVVVQLGGTHHALARAALTLGQHAEARSLADRALTYSSAQRGLAANVRQLLGEIFIRQDRFDADSAEQCFRDALSLAEPRGMRPLIAHCHFGLGRMYRRSGRGDADRRHFDIAEALYRDMDMPFWLRQLETESSRSR
jgi:tetratricopeptide (TPR) repeat protein